MNGSQIDWTYAEPLAHLRAESGNPLAACPRACLLHASSAIGPCLLCVSGATLRALMLPAWLSFATRNPDPIQQSIECRARAATTACRLDGHAVATADRALSLRPTIDPAPSN